MRTRVRTDHGTSCAYSVRRYVSAQKDSTVDNYRSRSATARCADIVRETRATGTLHHAPVGHLPRNVASEGGPLPGARHRLASSTMWLVRTGAHEPHLIRIESTLVQQVPHGVDLGLLTVDDLLGHLLRRRELSLHQLGLGHFDGALVVGDHHPQ